MRYLLAAEADKIQDFIFRSSRLREVVGASQLLTRFCKETPDLLLDTGHYGQDCTVCVNDGGSFRLIFADADPETAQAHARKFGVDLAELYRMSVGGSLSVANPTAIDGSFQAASKAANAALRRAKEQRHGFGATAHMPYVAFCASCGVELANRHGKLKSRRDSGRALYLCPICQNKDAERSSESEILLHEFGRYYQEAAEASVDPARVEWADAADDIAAFDLRGQNYVAYLVADGNNMGEVFGRCAHEKQLKQFSDELTATVARCLAEPAARFRRQVAGGGNMAPVLPLILGGDDLFALIPAPYALDFARRFCLAYETHVGALMQRHELLPQPQELVQDGPGPSGYPTVAAAVVVCKSKYPYSLAHQRAKKLLEAAKQQGKSLVTQGESPRSTVNFAVIRGNRLEDSENDASPPRDKLTYSLRPYWVQADDKPLSKAAHERGVDLQVLLTQRLALKNVPNKRVVEMQALLEQLPARKDNLDVNARLETQAELLRRLFKRSSETTARALRAAADALGQRRPADAAAGGRHYWRKVRRGDTTLLAHGFLDLVEAWDFAQNLDHAVAEYTAAEEEA